MLGFLGGGIGSNEDEDEDEGVVLYCTYVHRYGTLDGGGED